MRTRTARYGSAHLAFDDSLSTSKAGDTSKAYTNVALIVNRSGNHTKVQQRVDRFRYFHGYWLATKHHLFLV